MQIQLIFRLILKVRFFGTRKWPLVQWCECYARCDWSLPMIYQSTDTWMTSRETCFLCFVQHGARFWKCLWDNSDKTKWNPRKMFHWSYLQERKMEKRGQKELLTTLECLNYKKSLPSCFIASRDSPFSKMFSPLFCFAQDKALKNFSKKLYTIKIKKKEEEETKSSAWDLKNA